MMHYACFFCFRIFLDFTTVMKTREARGQTNGFLAIHSSKFKNDVGRGGEGGRL